MKYKYWNFDLRLAHRWAIASRKGAEVHHVIIVELTDKDGIVGLGEAAPSILYGETVATARMLLQKVNPERLSFDDVSGSMEYLGTLEPHQQAVICAMNLALLDGAAKRARQPLHDFLGLGFRENHHVTSFSIGIDAPEVIRQKVQEAEQYAVLKLKVGDARDRENLAALRSVAPDKPVRVDANEGWKTKEEALANIEWIARDRHIQFIEQPMPRDAKHDDLGWLKERSPLPIFADEAYHLANDVERCAECFHGVNVKLVKTGGASGAYEALQAARRAGLKTMVGCMIESSILTSAGAHLAELTDYLDIDGNLLITNDPYAGVSAKGGLLSFATAQEKFGLRVTARK